MISFPPAKINLGLRITEKRGDGFHNLETIFIATSLCDVLEIIPREDHQVLFSQSGIPLDIDFEKNLCVKAYKVMMELFELPGANIYLHKVIPFGAGLGGGSSDAAWIIKMCDGLYHLNLDDAQMMKVASTLGSDCPFFILNRPAFACGKGEKLISIEIDLQNLKMLIVKPPFGISTPLAYSKVKPETPENDLRSLIQAPYNEWKDKIFNDFEKALFSDYPELASIKQKFYDYGAVYASMSGSGSAFYGLFSSIPNIDWPVDYFVWKEK